MEPKNYEQVPSEDRYIWAVNRTKLGRAISQAKLYETDDEEVIKKIYVSYGGLVRKLTE